MVPLPWLSPRPPLQPITSPARPRQLGRTPSRWASISVNLEELRRRVDRLPVRRIVDPQPGPQLPSPVQLGMRLVTLARPFPTSIDR